MKAPKVALQWVVLRPRPEVSCQTCGKLGAFRDMETLTAKAHAKANPGHVTVVQRIVQSEYVAGVTP